MLVKNVLPLRSLRFRSYSLIRIHESDGLRRITLDDPKTRNSLSLNMMSELSKAVNYNKGDKQLRCIVIDAAGPIYSAGHNLKEMAKECGIEQQKEIFSRCTELMLSLRKHDVPVVAVVNGLAAAAGCQLVATCDFAIATEVSRFSTPGASFGLFCSTPGIPISRSVPMSLAAYMVLTGDSINATDALASGLVTKVVREDDLESEVERVYAMIKSKSRSVIKLGKEFFYRQLNLGLEEAMREGESVMVRNLQLPDGQEGIESFKGKRGARWNHED